MQDFETLLSIIPCFSPSPEFCLKPRSCCNCGADLTCGSSVGVPVDAPTFLRFAPSLCWDGLVSTDRLPITQSSCPDICNDFQAWVWFRERESLAAAGVAGKTNGRNLESTQTAWDLLSNEQLPHHALQTVLLTTLAVIFQPASTTSGSISDHDLEGMLSKVTATRLHCPG